MSRPRKCRRVCHFPQTLAFYPEGNGGNPAGKDVILTLDENEGIRHIDHEGFLQEQCGSQMGIARTTVQQIYADARKKLADVLVEGLSLRIQGGDYRLCDGSGQFCAFENCCRHPKNPMYQIPKGENQMRIAVTYENGEIFQHFGHTEAFKIYDVEDGKVVSSQVVSTGGSGHGALAGVLSSLKTDVLICGGIGGGAQAALAEAGIKLYGGVCGSADEAVKSLLAGDLDYDPNVHCDHHGEHHHEEGSCGQHGCGGHEGSHSCH